MIKDITKQFRYFAFVLGALAMIASTSQAITLSENFNDYGDTQVDLGGLGDASGGWAGAWSSTGGSFPPDYEPGIQLTYEDSFYSNAGNFSGSTHGAARAGGGSVASQAQMRSFETPLDGTIWISTLVQRGDTDDDVIFWLNRDVNTQNYVAIRSGDQNFRYANSTLTDAEADFGAGTTHLFLTRIDINVDGANDEVRFWVDPDLSDGVGSLGAAHFEGTGSDALGAFFSNIAVSFSNAGTGGSPYLDALRISNDVDGFDQVTVIPEPSTYALMFGLAVCAVAIVRQRKS